MFPDTKTCYLYCQQGEYQNHEKIASCAGYYLRTPKVWGNSASHYYVKRPNDLAMTHPSKTDWHWPYGIGPPAQQWADYEKSLEGVSTGLLTPGTL